MTEPQSWTLIGVFGAGMFAMLGIVSTLFVRILRAEIGGLRGEFTGLRGEFTGLRAELTGDITALRAEMNAKFDLLDRDVSAIARRVFPDEP